MTMELPEYPHFSELTKQHKPLFDELFMRIRPVISEFTFTNLFAWRRAYGFSVSMLGQTIVVKSEAKGGARFLPPLGDTHAAAGSIRRVMDETRASFIRVPDTLAGEFDGDGRISVTQDRDNADYLYRLDDLVRLSGRRYDGKRNLIKQFRSANQYSYVELDAANVAQCLPFQQAWCVMKDCDRNEGLRHEQSALFEMVADFAEFGLRGAAISISGTIQAFVIAEPLNPQTLVIHMLKAEPGITGLYQCMLNAFLSRCAGGFELVNMEQDLGIPGLRRAKQSYYPVRLINKHTLTYV